eukprot:4027767-Amphidinium_carterae.1
MPNPGMNTCIILFTLCSPLLGFCSLTGMFWDGAALRVFLATNWVRTARSCGVPVAADLKTSKAEFNEPKCDQFASCAKSHWHAKTQIATGQD